jgi:hypothetical protein
MRVPLEAPLERNCAGASAVAWRQTRGELDADLWWVSMGALTKRLTQAHTVGVEWTLAGKEAANPWRN